MSTTIDENHALVDLATLNEVVGATEIDDTGRVTITKKDLNNEMKTTTLQLHLGSWRIVRRRG